MDNQSKKKEILSVYEELIGVLSSIENLNGSWFDDYGFSDHANMVIKRAGSICKEITNIDEYLIYPQFENGRRGNIVLLTPARTKLKSLIGRLKGAYDIDMSPKNEGNTFIQTQSQNQTQSLTVLLELQEKIISEIPKYGKDTKERGFLEKLKSMLPTVKVLTDILSLALKIGAEFDLDPTTIHKLLGL